MALERRIANAKIGRRLIRIPSSEINRIVDTATLHRANIAHKECECKDGDRGGLAEWEKTHRKHEAKLRLDINRPSHGRT